MNEANQPPREILTIGHSTHESDRFVALLVGAGVELLVDVRRHPGSRRVPWTNTDNIGPLLEEAGIGYLHQEGLGGRRRPVEGSPNSGWRHPQFRGYADHLESAEFASAYAELEAEARARRTAVMCSEAQWWRCHRRLLSDRLLTDGWRVIHVGSDGRTTEHELTEFAEVCAGRLRYPEHPELPSA